MRAQAAMEFMLTYGWALAILIVMIVLLFYFSLIPGNLPPNSCSFNTRVLCNDIALATNQITMQSVVYVNISNEEPYPIINPALVVGTGGVNGSSYGCYPEFVEPGGSMLCVAVAPSNFGTGRFVGGSLYLTYNDCGLLSNYSVYKNCTNPPELTVAGTFSGSGQADIAFKLGDIYCVGNGNGNDNLSYYAPLYSTGGLGNWTQTTRYPINLTQAGCTIYQNNIYCIGSYNGITASNAVYYAPVTGTGVGNWTQTTSYPVPMYDGGCSAENGYIYCVGTNAIAPYNLSFFAQVSQFGIGSWQKTMSYPSNTANESCSMYDTRLYCATTGIGNNQKSIYFAATSSLGLGKWVNATMYPAKFSLDTCAAYDGYMYCVNSLMNGNSEYAPIYGNGMIGNWIATSSYPVKLFYAGCDIFVNHIYCVGDFFSNFNRNAVYYATVTSNGISSWGQTTSYPKKFNNAYCAVVGSSGGFYT